MYTFRFIKINLQHEMDPLHFKANGKECDPVHATWAETRTVHCQTIWHMWTQSCSHQQWFL